MNQRLYFYCHEQPTLELEGEQNLTLLRGADQPLAERRNNNSSAQTRLLMTDVQKSLLQTHIGQAQMTYAYTAYGHDPRTATAAPRVGFNGEYREPLTGAYQLGQGYRAYSPVLMRFQAPDSLSPFGDGGLNAYGYCGGDPVNYADPTGHMNVAQLLARRNAMRPTAPSKIVATRLPLSNRRPARTTKPALTAAPTGQHRTAHQGRSVEFSDRTEVTHFIKDEAPIFIPKSPKETFKQRRLAMKQSDEVYEQLLVLERHYLEVFDHFGNSPQGRRPPGRLNAAKLRSIGDQIAQRRKQLLGIRDAAERLRT